MLKNDLIDNLYKKTGKTVHKNLIKDIVEIINEHIIEELEADRIFTVPNFGTWSPAYYNSKRFKMKRIIKFIPHAAFRFLLQRKRSKFASKA